MKAPLVFSMLSLLSAAAFAQSNTVDSVKIPANAITMPERTLRMGDIDFGLYQGGFDLANGQTLYLMAQGRRMYAQVENGDRHELAVTGNGKFVSLDRQLKVSLERTGQGDMGGELLMVKSPAMAGQPVEYVLVAMRR